MTDQPQFIFVCTQHGAEKECKRGILATHPNLRFAFSRPGFLTFKVAEGEPLKSSYDLRNVFVRCSGFSGERLQFLAKEEPQTGGIPALADETELVSKLTTLLEGHSGRHIHVFSRDLFPPGHSLKPALQNSLGSQTYFPGTAPYLHRLIEMITRLAESVPDKQFLINQTAANNDRVLDLILIDPEHVWTGWHVVHSTSARWPGGIPSIEVPENMISRAYLKMVESLQWSRFPLADGDKCVEIGAAPGGSCQALLDRGAHVIGIDPAEVDERLTKYPNFEFMRGRGSEIRCRALSDVKWLFADTNVAPTHTLDTVERIVSHESAHVRGMLLTLKLSSLEMADEIPAYIKRVRSWGFSYIRARQLAHNRGEFCLAALRNKAMLRFGNKRTDMKQTKPTAS